MSANLTLGPINNATAVSLATSVALPPVDVSVYHKFSFQAVYTYGGGEDAAGTMKLQSSLDDSNFSDVPDSTLAYSSTAGNNVWEVIAKSAKYYRLYITKSSGSGGLTTVKFFGTSEQ